MSARFSQQEIAAFGARAETMIETLARISAEPGRLVRLFLSPEHRRAADLTGDWMREAGLDVSEDALGTVRGHWPSGGNGGTAARPRLLIGSHLDSVIDAGKYDGPLGIVAGILAAEYFMRRGDRPRFGIDVLAFGDEEGSRFPSTLASSSACAGVFDHRSLKLADGNGIALADALRAYGKDPAAIPTAAYRRGEALGYVEVHIEQGPVLETKDQPLGVVTGIVGQSRLRVVVEGDAGHAGTVPMSLRRDALAGAAEMIVAVERIGREHAADGMVATVGRIEASPGAVNIIPASAVFTVDLRALSDRARLDGIEAFKAAAVGIAAVRRLTVAFELFHEIATTPCDEALQQKLAESIADLGCEPVRLPSGAGHDGQMMAKLCPAAMLFVRCRGGVSHNPAEYASPADMGLAVAALIRCIERLAQR